VPRADNGTPLFSVPVSGGSTLQRHRAWIVLAALAVVLPVVVVLFSHPSQTYQERGHVAAWRADVARVVSDASLTGCFASLDARLTSMPGVGAIGQICVVRSSTPGSVVVTFKPLAGPYDLAHVSGPDTQLHQCAHALGAGWWQVTSMNLTTLNCPHGYHLIRSP
jgi:hypothetical protein